MHNNVRGLRYSILQPVPISVFWNITPRRLVYVYQSVLLPLSGLKYLEDGGNKLPQNADNNIHCAVYQKTEILINNHVPQISSYQPLSETFLSLQIPYCIPIFYSSARRRASARTVGPCCHYQVSKCNLLNTKQKLITARSKGTVQLFSVHGDP